MNPLIAVITLLANLRADLYNKFNAALEKAKPLEQFEAGSAACGILNEIDWAKERLQRSGEELQSTLENAGKFLSGFESKLNETPEMAAARFLDELTASIEKSALAAAIGEKKVVSIDDHNNALTAAKETAATEAKEKADGEFNAKLTAIKLIADRRTEAVTRVGEIAAAQLTDEILAGETFEASLVAIEGRISAMKEKDITAENRPRLYTDLLTKGSEEEFTASMEIVLEAAGGKLATIKAEASKEGPKVSFTAAAPIPGASGERKKLVI